MRGSASGLPATCNWTRLLGSAFEYSRCRKAISYEKLPIAVPNWADRIRRVGAGMCRPRLRLALSGCPLRAFRQMAGVLICFVDIRDDRFELPGLLGHPQRLGIGCRRA